MGRLVSSQGVVGFVVLNVANPFWTEVAKGAEASLKQRGFSLVLCNSYDSVYREINHLRSLQLQGARGVLINPVISDSSYLERFRKRGVKIVMVDRASRSSDTCHITVDDVQGGETVARYFFERGHTKIMLVNGPLSLRQYADRRQGVIRAAKAFDLNPEEAIISIYRPVLDLQNGEEGAQQVIENLKHATAVFCANDISALGVMQGLKNAGLSIPGDVQVIGYDDVIFAETTTPPLTTIRQPKYEMGNIAAELLAQEMMDPLHHTHQGIVLEPKLIVRQSSG